jgi:hypothetical protein
MYLKSELIVQGTDGCLENGETKFIPTNVKNVLLCCRYSDTVDKECGYDRYL